MTLESWRQALVKRLGISHQQLLFAIGIALVAITGVSAVLMFFRMSKSRRWVTHTLEVRAVAPELLSRLNEVEAGQRGYLLTHDGNFLGPYEDAVRHIRPAFDKLRTLTLDNPARQHVLDKLWPVISSKLQFLQEMLTLGQSGHFDQAIELAKARRGEALSNDIRTLIGQFSENELRLLQTREDEAERTRAILLALILSTLAAAAAVAVFAVNSQRILVTQLRDEAKKRETAEATLRQTHKMEAVGQLTGGIAHDFNNLLTVILGNLDTVRRRMENTDTAAAAPLLRQIDLALQGTRNAAKLTHRLLAFSRQQPLQPIAMDLNKLLSGMSDFLCRTVGAPIKLETVLMGGLWLTFADANQVENALLNLVVNARDAMPEGGSITIETANAYLDEAYAACFGDVKPGQYVVLSVSDSGCGIAPAVLERVFEPFFTTKQTGAGTGLGLSMVYGFVKQSGGHIRIYSEVGQGTTVKVYLPRLAQATDAASVPAAADPDLKPVVGAKAGETVLVVEDGEGVLDFAVSVLEDLGYRVLSAKDGPEALAILASEAAIDLLFTDVVLPNGMTGRQLADAMLAARPKLPVLFTTGYSRNAIVHQGRLDANVHLLSKPYTQRDLGQKVRALLDGRAS